MSTFILLLSLASSNGGVSIDKVEFTGSQAEQNCNLAAEKWVSEMDSFAVSAQAFCTVK